MANDSEFQGKNAGVSVLVIPEDPVPLRLDDGGTVKVGLTRVTLDTVVGAFENGYSAEEIVYKFPSLGLADVYSVIGYYLRHQSEIRDYLHWREGEAAQLRKEVEARWPSNGLRARLLARLAERQQPA